MSDWVSIKRRYDSFITNYQSRAPERVLSKHSHFHNKQRKGPLYFQYSIDTYIYLDSWVLNWYLLKKKNTSQKFRFWIFVLLISIFKRFMQFFALLIPFMIFKIYFENLIFKSVSYLLDRSMPLYLVIFQQYLVGASESWRTTSRTPKNLF